jgi:hypothetical protein
MFDISEVEIDNASIRGGRLKLHNLNLPQNLPKPHNSNSPLGKPVPWMDLLACFIKHED